MRILIVLVIALAGCSGDETDAVCSKAQYDPCETEHDCSSNLCHNFAGEFQVCTVGCTAAAPCANGATCDPMGVCKPAQANACELP